MPSQLEVNQLLLWAVDSAVLLPTRDWVEEFIRPRLNARFVSPHGRNVLEHDSEVLRFVYKLIAEEFTELVPLLVSVDTNSKRSTVWCTVRYSHGPLIVLAAHMPFMGEHHEFDTEAEPGAHGGS